MVDNRVGRPGVRREVATSGGVVDEPVVEEGVEETVNGGVEERVVDAGELDDV